MNEKSNALRLADRLTSPNAGPWDNLEAAAELRRLHELNEGLRDQNTELDKKLAKLECVNAQLLEALERIDGIRNLQDAQVVARAAIAAAKGEA